MKKTIFEENGRHLYQTWGLSYSLSYLAGGRRTEIYRRMGTKTFTLFERTSQKGIFEFAYKWKAE